MSIYPPPSQTGLIFDLDNWEQLVGVSDLSASYLDARYLQYTTAQGDETFSNTINTGYSDVDGSTICNTFDTYSTPATTSLFDTTNNASQVIRLGIGQTTGTIKLGKQYDGLTTYGTNQIGGWETIGENTVGVNNPSLDYFDETVDATIGDSQTTGVLNLGTIASRSGEISFSKNSNSTINIGSSNSTVRLVGEVNIINATTELSQTNGAVYITDNYTIVYSSVVDELNIINGSSSTKSLYLPSTIRDSTFWITTLTRSLYIRTTGGLLIDFLCDATTDLLINPYTIVCIVACVGSNSFNLIYSSNEMYQPMRLYPNLTSFAPSSIQSGYITYTGAVNASKTSGQTTATSLNLTSSALPKGIYYIDVYGYVTATNAGGLIGLSKPFFVGCVSTTLNLSTVVNNIGATYFDPASYTPTVNNTVLCSINANGYYNNATTGTILYGYGRIDAGTANILATYRVNLDMYIRRIY